MCIRDRGKTWTEYELESIVHPRDLINTTPDGSGSKFILEGISQTINGSESLIYTIDFSGAFDGKTCEDDKDFEDWNLAEGKCVNGVRYKYRRRKQDAQCLVGKGFEDLKLYETTCNSCTAGDYECAFELVRDANGNSV